MKSKNDSPSNNSMVNVKGNFPSHNNDSTTNKISKSPSNDIEEKNIPENQEETEQHNFNDFNITFFFPKALCKDILEDEETPENDNNNMHQNNDFASSEVDDINDKNLILNLNDNNNGNEKKFNNLIGKDLKAGKNINNVNQFCQSNKIINNINNYFVNNNNNTQINFLFNNNHFNNNIVYSSNNSNIIDLISNNQPFYNKNNVINQNINNNYIFNNNIYSDFSHQNQFQNKNPPLFQINDIGNNIQKRKKYNNDYIIEMFGRRGWICELCNNFNYEERKKCNRCYMLKKPRKIDGNIKKGNSLKLKKNWICKYCRNYNFPFRLVCNRCQEKKKS